MGYCDCSQTEGSNLAFHSPLKLQITNPLFIHRKHKCGWNRLQPLGKFRDKVTEALNIPQLRLNWSETEHEKFLFAIKLYESDKKKWKKVAAYIGTRTAHQCRGHFSAYSGNRYKTKMLKRGVLIDGGGGGGCEE